MNMTLSPKARQAYQFLNGLAKQKKTGEKFPTVPELMKKLSVSQVTIQSAYNVLEAEGIIERKGRGGIVIRDRLATGEFAIVTKPSLLNPDKAPFFPLAIKLLTEKIHEQHEDYKVKLHMGKQTSTGAEFPSTLDINDPYILAGLRGVFSFAPLYELEERLNQSNVPLVELGTESKLSYCVNFEPWPELIKQAVEYLSKIGCQSAGLIWPRAGFRNIEKHEDCAAILTELCRNTSIKCDPAWMKPILLHEQELFNEKDAFEFMRNLWQMRQRPEAVIVCDEIYCRGALMAISSLGLKMPQDIKLITQNTHGLSLPYHMPVTRIEYNAEELAIQAVKTMMNLINGIAQEEKNIRIPGTLQIGTTT